MLDVEIKEFKKAIVLSLKGDLVFKETDDVVNIFMKELNKNPQVIGIDCQNLKNLDSSGLGVFLRFSKESDKKHINLIMLNITDQISSLFDISKLKELFEIMSYSEFQSQYL